MSDLTLVVTQRVSYYDRPETTVEEILTAVQNGTYDDKRNEVLDDHIEVYNAQGELVYDSKTWIGLKLKIENIYEGGDVITTYADTHVPPPPADVDSEEYEEWGTDYIYCHTGTGNTKGDAAYFVKVIESESEAIIPVDFEWEFGL